MNSCGPGEPATPAVPAAALLQMATTNCRTLEARHGPGESDLIEFVDLLGRGVKIDTSTHVGHHMAMIKTGTDRRLIPLIAANLQIPEQLVIEIVSVLAAGAFLCREMAKEVIEALQTFLEQPVPPGTTACVWADAPQLPAAPSPCRDGDTKVGSLTLDQTAASLDVPEHVLTCTAQNHPADDRPPARIVRSAMGMTVDDVRQALADLPGDQRVIVPRSRGEAYSPLHSIHPSLYGEPDGEDRRIWLPHDDLDKQIADPAGLCTEEDRAPAGAEPVILFASVD